jgi:hypothetical protein
MIKNVDKRKHPTKSGKKLAHLGLILPSKILISSKPEKNYVFYTYR